MTLPRPEAGLVVRYSYLWFEEQRQGRDEGSKDRPCVVVLSVGAAAGETVVLVVPITHTPPAPIVAALEVPAAVKRHLGLDTARSWVVLAESNLFIWPGPDLRRIPDRSSVDYGFLPPRFFTELKRRFVDEQRHAAARMVRRII